MHTSKQPELLYWCHFVSLNVVMCDCVFLRFISSETAKKFLFSAGKRGLLLVSRTGYVILKRIIILLCVVMIPVLTPSTRLTISAHRPLLRSVVEAVAAAGGPEGAGAAAAVPGVEAGGGAARRERAMLLTG